MYQFYKKLTFLLSAAFLIATFHHLSYTMETKQETKDELFQKIYNAHLKLLPETNIIQGPFCLYFSATPGMGKTHLSKILEKKYHAIRLNNDELRKFMALHGAPEQVWRTGVYDYMKFFITHYTGKNRFFILDASADRWYATMLPFLEEEAIPYTIIRLEVSDETVKDRIRKREQDFLSGFDRMKSDYLAFGELGYPMYILNNEDSSLHANFFNYIDHFLANKDI